MPLPTPHKDEKQSDFMSRCMGSEAIKEFKDQKQKVAVCYSQFRKHKHKKAKGSDEPHNPYDDIIIFVTD
jgi:hypothetical protein